MSGLHTDRAPLCESCGYDLRGRREGRCPECGRPFELVAVYFEADTEVKARWKTWQTTLATTAMCPLLAAVVYPFPVCVTWIMPPCLFLVATVLLIRGLAWRYSRRGMRLFAACTPGLRLDYERTMRIALTLHLVLAGFALVMGIVWLRR